MYNVKVKYERKKRNIKVHPDMSWLEFETLCKQNFDIPYTRFFVIGGHKRDYIIFFNQKTNTKFHCNGESIKDTLKEIELNLLLMT